MRKRVLQGVLALIALAASSLAMALPIEAREIEARTELVKMEVRGGSLALRPSTGDALSLTVSAGDFRSTERFATGQLPIFVPVNENGFQLPDGVYTWELVVIPELPSTRTVAEGTPANGRFVHQLPAPAGRSQSGAFTILNGSIVNPTLVEETTGPVRVIGAPEDQHPTEIGAAVSYDDSDRATLASQ